MVYEGDTYLPRVCLVDGVKLAEVKPIKGVLVILVRAKLAKVHVDVTDGEIVPALTDVQKMAGVFNEKEA